MPRRRGTTRKADTAETRERSSTAGIQKNTRNRQAPQRYGNQSDDEVSLPASAEKVTVESESETINPGRHSSRVASTPETENPRYNTPRTASIAHEIHLDLPGSSSYHPSPPGAGSVITMNDMGALLRSPEDNIVNQVVRRLQPEGINPKANRRPNSLPHPSFVLEENNPPINRISRRIKELEDQISQLRTERIHTRPHSGNGITEPGTYNPSLHVPAIAMESPPGIAESVEALFPGVERSTLTQIIETGSSLATCTGFLLARKNAPRPLERLP